MHLMCIALHQCATGLHLVCVCAFWFGEPGAEERVFVCVLDRVKTEQNLLWLVIMRVKWNSEFTVFVARPLTRSYAKFSHPAATTSNSQQPRVQMNLMICHNNLCNYY